jgi:pimeloyl-ACP methyl ester carboxylesterase
MYGLVYTQSLSNALYTLIPDAGHFPQIEQPEHLLNVVREFVDSIPVPPIAGSLAER